MSGGKIDIRQGGVYRDKDDGDGGGGGSVVIGSADNSISIIQDDQAFDLSVNRPYPEFFAANEGELLSVWTLARATGKACKIFVTNNIIFTNDRDFVIFLNEPIISIEGYPTVTFDFSTHAVFFQKVWLKNIVFRTASDTYLYTANGYVTLENVSFQDDVLSDPLIANMKVHIRNQGTAQDGTGRITIKNISHLTQNNTWNESGNIQPFIILNEGNNYDQFYISITDMIAERDFNRFSKVLIDADYLTDFRVSGDTSWLYDLMQKMPGAGNIHADSSILKIASVDRMNVQHMPFENIIPALYLIGVNSQNNSEVFKFSNIITISKSDLKKLVDSEALLPGHRYMVQFQTKHVIPYTNQINTGSVETLILTANSLSTFNKHVQSADFPKDYIEFDFTDRLCEDLTTARDGKITLRRDIYGNETPYDFRNVKFRRWKIDAATWNDATAYPKGTLIKHENILYKFPTCELYSESEIGSNPLVDTRWTKYLDITTTRYLAPKQFTGLLWTNPGGVISTGIVHAAYQDFYTFSDAAGAERSSWFRNCVIKGIDKQRDLLGAVVLDMPYNNIVFIETADATSYNNYIDGQCYDLTFSDHTFNNRFTQAVRNNIFDSNCFDNNLTGFWQNKTGTGFSQNTSVVRMVASSLFGNNCTGNTFAGEAVYNTIKDGFAQNNTQQDFTGNLVDDAFHYNSCQCDMWDNHLMTNLVNNFFGARFQGNTVGAGTYNCTFFSGVANSSFPVNTVALTVFSDLYSGLDCTAQDVAAILQANFSKRIYNATDSGIYLEFHTGTALRMLPVGFPESLQIVEGYSNVSGSEIYVRFKKEVQSIDSFFLIQITATKWTVPDTGVIQTDPHWVKFLIDTDIKITDSTRIAYIFNDDPLTFTDLTTLSSFSDFPIRNNSTTT